MAISVNTNTSALTAQAYLGKATMNTQTSMERLSSGLRINSAKDDAAGMQISNRLDAQFSGMNVAIRNANDAISMSQTAESGLKSTAMTLNRMRDLAVQAANGSNGKDERAALNQEVQDSIKQLNQVAETTSFGGQNLLNGTFGSKSFQVGSSAGQAVMITLGSARADDTKMGGGLSQADSASALAGQVSATAGGKWTSGLISTDGSNIKATTATTFTVVTNGVTVTATMTIPSGMDSEETATYINGHSNGAFSASVDDSGQLQYVTAAGTTNFSLSADIGGTVSYQKGTVAAPTAMTAPVSTTPEVRTISDLDLRTAGGAQAAIGIIDQSIKYVDGTRAKLGSTQNTLDAIVTNLTTVSSNVAASSGRIKDVDFASESVMLTKNQILQQSSAAILAQAKSSPQIALSLL